MRSATLGLVIGLALWAPAAAAQEVVPGDSVAPRASRGSWIGRPAVGVEVGYSRSDLAVAGGGGGLVTSRQGAITGVFLQFPFGEVLAVRPALLFSLKGGQTGATVAGSGEVDIDIELAYLELPLLLRASFPTGKLRPVIFAGPAVALQIGCDFRFTGPADSVRATCGQDNLNTVRQWDFGLVGGGGAEIRLRRATMALEARYTVGTRSVLENLSLKNRSFSVTLGLTF